MSSLLALDPSTLFVLETVYIWSAQPTMWIGFLKTCMCGVCVYACALVHTYVHTQSVYPNNTIDFTLCGGATYAIRVQSLRITTHNTSLIVFGPFQV